MKVSPEAPFNWKFLLIGTFSAKGICKNFLILQVDGSSPALPTPPVIKENKEVPKFFGCGGLFFVVETQKTVKNQKKKRQIFVKKGPQNIFA